MEVIQGHRVPVIRGTRCPGDARFFPLRRRDKSVGFSFKASARPTRFDTTCSLDRKLLGKVRDTQFSQRAHGDERHEAAADLRIVIVSCFRRQRPLTWPKIAVLAGEPERSNRRPERAGAELVPLAKRLQPFEAIDGRARLQAAQHIANIVFVGAEAGGDLLDLAPSVERQIVSRERRA